MTARGKSNMLIWSENSLSVKYVRGVGEKIKICGGGRQLNGTSLTYILRHKNQMYYGHSKSLMPLENGHFFLSTSRTNSSHYEMVSSKVRDWENAFQLQKITFWIYQDESN